MKDHEQLHDVLREWKAPEPTAAMDAKVLEAFHAARPPLWKSLWTWRISVPAPALAALVLLWIVWFVEFRPAPAPVSPRVDTGYVTRLDVNGFQPLPNGAARVVSVGAIQQ
ncbi:MAG TPA: hypothetical protein VKE70_01710 [Candidatus Solibacter sp.]|nr:hypothetical protein [Candidatus Solibacter sp.]